MRVRSVKLAARERAPRHSAIAPRMTWTTLHGWGAQRRVTCDLSLPETPAQVKAQVDRAGTIARGLGRSYGDQALNEGGRVV